MSISDAETESGNEKDNSSDKEEVEEEPEKLDKNAKYTKEDFIAKKHSSEREPWVQKPMPFLIRNSTQRNKNITTSSVSG